MRFTAELFDLIAKGKKTQTVRPPFFARRFYGMIGKVSSARDSSNGRKLRIRIQDVFESTLGMVANDPALWRREGCKSAKEFENIWRGIYRRWKNDEPVTVIRFKLVP